MIFGVKLKVKICLKLMVFEKRGFKNKSCKLALMEATAPDLENKAFLLQFSKSGL
ncbi:hypothetical protein FEM08_18630 [Flavobacterium gilvum]|nr:hypothetical protein FEM08_18630 [Flavobacterium gilvum]